MAGFWTRLLWHLTGTWQERRCLWQLDGLRGQQIQVVRGLLLGPEDSRPCGQHPRPLRSQDLGVLHSRQAHWPLVGVRTAQPVRLCQASSAERWLLKAPHV